MRVAEEAAATWAVAAVAVAVDQGFAQVDLDDLLHEEPEAAVQVGLACVRAASDRLTGDEAAKYLQAFLVVPLETALHLRLDPPDATALLGQAWRYGLGCSVPGLYLARPDSVHWDRVDEEYRREIPVPLSGWYAEYRTWRAPEQAAAGWEYDRAVYFWLIR